MRFDIVNIGLVHRLVEISCIVERKLKGGEEQKSFESAPAMFVYFGANFWDSNDLFMMYTCYMDSVESFVEK